MERLRIVCGDSRTMQGQERSIVFLSMVATPGNAVKQSSQSYAQRFNVALSRARDRLYLVRSVSTHDLKPGDLKLAVLEHFQDPMPEGRALVGKGIIERCESGFEREVCQMLLDANYRVRSQVKAGPFSIDLVVEGADDRRLAIELDGDAWHGPEKWHEDMSRQAALERAGWMFWRVFGSQWHADKGYWWQNLVQTMEQMGIAPIGAEASEDVFTEFRVVAAGELVAAPDAEIVQPPTMNEAFPAAGTIEQIEDTVESHPGRDVTEVVPAPARMQPTRASDAEFALAVQQPHRPYPQPAPGDPLHPLNAKTGRTTEKPSAEVAPAQGVAAAQADADRFYDDDYRQTLRSIGCEIVDETGPMTFKHLCDRVARLHGFQRTGSEIKRIVWMVMRDARARSHHGGDSEVFWPEGSAVSDWIAYRGLKANGETRSWQDIPLPERLGLAREILQQDHPEPDLAMSRALGFSRLRDRMRWELNDLLARARETLKREGQADQADDNVTYIRQHRG